MRLLHVKSGIFGVSVLFNLIGVFLFFGSTRNHPEQPSSCPARPINCTIDERRNVRCWRDDREVYLPFSFVKKQLSYDVDGRVVGEDTSRLHFDYRTPGIKSKRPVISAYSPFGVFANFGTFTVERRSKVGCVSGREELPLSIQWAPTPYFYPIQIAQFGLQHYSQMLNESAWKVILLSEDRIVTTSSHLPSVHSSILTVENAAVTVRLSSDLNLPVLMFEWIPQTADSSFSVLIFDRAQERNVTLTYEFSEDARCVWSIKSGLLKHFVYSLGSFVETTELRPLIRDLKVDVLKALLVEEEDVRNKDQYRPIELKFNGPVKVKLPLKQQTHAHKDQFLKAAEWFAKTQNENGGWSVPVVRKWSEKLQLKAGWTSAMGQGHALSLLSRAFNLTNDRRFLIAAAKGLGPFEKKSVDGGVQTQLFNHSWYEEYPTSPPSLVLNGFMYSLVGLYDFSQLQTKEAKQAKRLFDTGIASLKALLPLFDTGSGSIYDLKHVTMQTPPNLARGDYHDTHVYLLKLLHVITDDRLFKTFSDRWFSYSLGNRAKHN